MNYRRALIVSMMSARTAVISISAPIAVWQSRHLKTRQFHWVPLGAVPVTVSMPSPMIGCRQSGFGQIAAMIVSVINCGEKILA